MTFKKINPTEFEKHLIDFRAIQIEFQEKYGVNDIFSNSKIYEVVIANELNHELIPGHSGSKDAFNKDGEFEYKHFKETSTNHSWTFNDYSEATIESLKKVKQIIFAHIDDKTYPPSLDWYIAADGIRFAKYLKDRTEDLLKRRPKGKPNARRMINISAVQLEKDLKLKKSILGSRNKDGKYFDALNELNNLTLKFEALSGVHNILTSNKIWEVLVAMKLGHNVNSEQGGRAGAHDAFDAEGLEYEYKVSKNHSWNFQDISENVLQKYLHDEAIILAIVDKTKLLVTKIYKAKSEQVVARLREKLTEKQERFKKANKTIKRTQVSLSKGDLERVGAVELPI